MNRRKRRELKTAETLNYLWAAGLAITLAVAFGIYTLSRYGDLVRENKRLLVSALALSATTMLLFARYLTSTHHELGLLEEYLSPTSAPRIGPSVYYNIFLLAILFGVLIAVSHLLLIYSALIILLNLADLWGGWQGKGKISPVFDKKLAQSLSPRDRKIIEIIRHHYLENPTLERVATMMFFNWMAFSLALVAYYQRINWPRDLAYLIVILNILVGEFIIHRWRTRRDRKLKEVDPTIG
jgi:hypothetical protein